MAKIPIPDGWTKQDVHGFLKFISPDPEDKEARDKLLQARPNHHCYLNDPCKFWQQTGKNDYQGYCTLASGSCATAILNHQNPLRWAPK